MQKSHTWRPTTPMKYQCVRCWSRHGESAPLANCLQGVAPVRPSCDKWIPWYRARATCVPGQFAPWSSRRLGLVTVGELDLDLLFRHFSRPKHYFFLVPELLARTPIESQWVPTTGDLGKNHYVIQSNTMGHPGSADRACAFSPDWMVSSLGDCLP